MSDAKLIQDLVTIAGPQSTTIIQPESAWIEVLDYQDAAFYLEITACTGVAANVVNLYVQSSPTKDSGFFDASANGSSPGSIANFQFNIGTTAVGIQAIKLSRWATEANQPLARYLRWKIVLPAGAGAYSITFRLWATLNQSGS